jgi:hypothetical protein
MLKAITIKEPWASLICMPTVANKSIPIKACEIRTWKPPSGLSTVCVHSSANDATITHDLNWVVNKFWDSWYAFENPDCVPCVPGKDFFYASVVVGLVDVIGFMEIDPKWSKNEKLSRVVDAGYDPYYAEWAEPPYAWMLANPRRLEQGIYCRGSLGCWYLPDSVEKHVLSTAFIDNDGGAESYQPLPLKPSGIAKTLGKPNYAEITRKAKAQL